jgi:hypothetical protein
MIMHDESEKNVKVAIVDYFKVLSQNFPGETD